MTTVSWQVLTRIVTIVTRQDDVPLPRSVVADLAKISMDPSGRSPSPNGASGSQAPQELRAIFLKYQAKWSKGGAVLPKLPQPNVPAQGSSNLSRGPPLPSLPKPVTNTALTRGASTSNSSATMSCIKISFKRKCSSEHFAFCEFWVHWWWAF